jgi:hypothetical protein
MTSQDLCPSAASGPSEIDAIEAALTRAFTGARSTPFLAEAPISSDIARRAEAALRTTSILSLFSRAPTLGVWGVLTPLSRGYDESRNVYRHISTFTRENLDEPLSRDTFKTWFRIAARRIGLPVSGNEPTGLFFAPLGPPRAFHGALAEAFVNAAMTLGPPAIEDTPAARQWQRMAVAVWCSNLTRLRATIAFDQAAWCAARFTAWRRGEAPIGEAEANLFAAYDAAMARRSRRRTDLVVPPRLAWTGATLAFDVDTAALPQTLGIGQQPRAVKGGSRVAFPPPWQPAVRWSCGGLVARDIPAGPGPDEVLVFEEAGGALLARVARGAGHLELAAERHVVLARRPFTAPSFGPAIPSPDTDCLYAWTEAGDHLSFDDGTILELATPREAALWIDAAPLGRSGSLPLHGCEGRLELRLEAGLGAPERILRARLGDMVRYATIRADATGAASLDLAALALDRQSDPARARFEVLAPGAAGDLDARAELAITAWIWPGVTRDVLDTGRLPAPAHYLPGRSAGLRLDGDALHVDLRADVEAPVLGLADEGGAREFRLSLRTERLWHVRVADGSRRLVPRQARLVFGHANRHDSLLLRSEDQGADLVVLGRVWKRPFLWQTILEIPASALATDRDGTDRDGADREGAARGAGADPQDGTPDDRILLRRADGRQDVLVHLVRVEDARAAELAEDEAGITLKVELPADRDAIRVRIEALDGQVEDGAIALSSMPVDAPLPRGVSVRYDGATRRAEIRIERRATTRPALARFFLRARASGVFEPLADAQGASLAVALDGTAPPPDLAMALRLARFLTEPDPIALAGQVGRVLGPHYAAAMCALGAPRLVGRIQPVVALARADGGNPRHDLVGVAPWIFEAQASAFRGLPTGSGLAPLAAMADSPATDDPPDPSSDRPLDAWLDTVSRGEAPSGLSTESLAAGFRSLRFRLHDTDLRLLVGQGPDAAAAALLSEVHIEALDRLRAFDHNGGGDPRAARFAALLERFARAASLGQTEDFLARLAARTGLDPATCGRVLTLILRAGPEIFAYFRGLWSHAVRHHARQHATPGPAAQPSGGDRESDRTGQAAAAMPDPKEKMS